MPPTEPEGVPSGLTPALNTTLSGPPAPEERIVVPTPLAWMLPPESSSKLCGPAAAV
jgi:hypothetical protein